MRSQRISVRGPPSSRASQRLTSALVVPAAGYRCVDGSRAGSAGSPTCQSGTADSSTRATSSASEVGAHQNPRYRPSSSEAANSATPCATSGPSGWATGRPPDPSVPTTCNEAFAQ